MDIFVFFGFSLLALLTLAVFLSYYLMKKEETGEYVWVGSGENPVKHLK